MSSNSPGKTETDVEMDTMVEKIKSSKRMGNIEFYIEERNEYCVISRMPVQKGVLNPFGIVQAGALVWLADVTASILVLEGRASGGQDQAFPLAIDLHTTLVGNQRSGDVRAEARFVKKGRKVMVIRTRLLGQDDKLLAEVTSTHVPAGK
jgi:uncharacterized protein (TIGR00369 family)